LVQLSCQRTALEKLLDNSVPDVRMAQNHFASAHCFFQLKQIQDALEKFREAKIIWMQAAGNAASQFSLTSCFKMIAECHYASKNYGEALDVLHEEQQLTEDIAPRRIRLKNMAMNCLDRARCYLQLNREDDAEECRTQAISFATSFYQEVHFERANCPNVRVSVVAGPEVAIGNVFVSLNAPLSFLKRKILSIDDVPEIHLEQFVLHEFAETEKHFRPKHFKNTMDEFAQAMATWTLTQVGNDFWENHDCDRFEILLGKMERVSYFAILTTL